ncbi:MAG: hypothetical protein U1F23_01800 [Lysobacterales bacterium]
MRILPLLVAAIPSAALAAGAHLDPGFGTGGVAEVEWSAGSAAANAVGVDGSGRIVLGGFAAGPWGDDDFALLRLLPDGTFDTTYATDAGGVRLVDFDLDGIGPNSDDVINDLVVLDDGTAIALGDAHFGFGALNSQFALVRTDSSGVLDPGFGSLGLVHFNFQDFGNIDFAFRLALDSEDRIVTTGMVNVDFAVNETLHFWAGLARLTPDGQFDATFASGGYFSVPFWSDPTIPPPRHSNFNYPLALAFDDSERILLGGSVRDPIPSDAVAYRVSADGAYDDTFGQYGHSLLGIDSGAITALHAMDGGRFIAAGEGGATYDAAELFFARFEADGTLDTTFGNAGIAELPTPGAFVAPDLIVPMIDGGWLAVAGGSLIEPYGVQRPPALARIDANGQFDTDFGDNGIVTLDLADGRHFYATRAAVQPDGKIVVAGAVQNPAPDATLHFAAMRVVLDPDNALFADGFDGT